MTLPKRKLLPVEAAQALDTLHGVVRREQTANNQQTAQAVADAAVKMEQARAEALKLGPVDPRFISLTTAAPRWPTDEEYAAAGGQDSRIIGSRLTPEGGVQLIRYNGAAGWWDAYGTPTYTSAQAARTGVDATLYGVREGASAQTLMDAIAATPDGGTLVCPRVKLIHRPGVSMAIRDRNGLTIQGNGLVIEADPALPDGAGETGHGPLHENCRDIHWFDVTYDGRLDVRTPIGGDGADSGGQRSGFTVLSWCDTITFTRCKGINCMMDGFLVGHSYPDHPVYGVRTQDNMPRNVQLIDCVALYNYRQGLSAVGSKNLLIDGGEYAYTGKHGAGKWTAPGAGIDLEPWTANNWWNEDVVIRGNPKIHHNVGTGLMIHMSSYRCRVESAHIHHNGGGGLMMDPANIDVSIDGVVIEYNNQGRPDNSDDMTDVYLAGINTRFRGIIRTVRGTGLEFGRGMNPDIQGVTMENMTPQVGVTAGNMLIHDSAGQLFDIDPHTGVYLGSDPAKHYVIPQTGGIVADNVVINGSWKNDVDGGLNAAIVVKGTGTKVFRNEARNTKPVSVTTGILIQKQCGQSGQNVSNYPKGVVADAPGERLTRLPEPYFTINKTDSVALSGYTAADYSKKVTLLSDDPDVLRYEVEWTVIYDAQDADRQAQFDIVPTVEGRKRTAVSVQARSTASDSLGPVAAWREGDSALIGIGVPRAFSVITVTAVVEVRRA